MGDYQTLLASIRSFDDKKICGDNFEKFCRWFLLNDRVCQNLFSKVYLWKDYPDRWLNQDIGIDIVAVTTNGEHYAVQCKCYGEGRKVTKNDIGKFLSTDKTAPKNIKFACYCLMVSNKAGLHHLVVGAVNDGDMDVINGFDFEKSSLEYPSDISDIIASDKPRYKPKKIPHKHQKEAIDAVKAGFASEDRGQLVMACGTGKTYTSLWIKEVLQARLVLVLVPSLTLLGQMLREWAQQAEHQFTYLCVCSDETVDENYDDHPVSSQRSYRVTGDVEEIAQFMRENHANGVIFCTYHSSGKIVSAQKMADVSFDLAIADEAHRCATLGDDNCFRLILDAEKIHAKLRLFMTATPRIHQARKSKGDEDDVVEIIPSAGFGEEFYRYSFADAIRDKQLTDYKLILIGVDDPMIKAYIAEGKHQVVEEEVEEEKEKEKHIRDMAAWIGLSKAIEKYKLGRLISFHSRIKRAQNFAKLVKKWSGGAIQADYVEGRMPTFKRSQKLDILKRGNAQTPFLLANARCLSEGVDVPNLDAIAFIDPRRSQVDIVQAVGRAIRKSEEKECGYIFIPVYLASYEDAEEALGADAFAPIWQVVRALKSHDAILAEEINAAEFSRQHSLFAGGGISEKIEIWLPDAFSKISGKRLEAALYSRLVEVTAESWQVGFRHLQLYSKGEGHANPPATYKNTAGYCLGTWVSTQRKAKKKNTLPTEKITLLEALGGFVWDALEAQWQEGFDALKTYIEETGHANPPARYKNTADYCLGKWVSHQRAAKKNSILSTEKITLLEALGGFVWDAFEEKWQQGFDALKIYIEETGHANPPRNYKNTADYCLGQWVSKQRAAKKNSILPAEKINQLEALAGFVWVRDVFEGQWQQGFDALKTYIEETGHANPPSTYKNTADYCLGQWVSHQRTAKKNSILSAEKITLLEALGGFVWDAFEAQWQEGFDALKIYTEETGHANPPKNYKNTANHRLGQWVSVQRRAKKNSILPTEKITLLEALGGFVWDALEEKWQEGFDALKIYIEETGHANPPATYKNTANYRLGQWVSHQRTAKKKNTLPTEKINQLEALGGFVWDALEAQWQEGFDALKTYIEETGHANPPTTYKNTANYRLGTWVGTQRRAKKNNILPAEKINQLESLDNFVWDAFEEKWQQGFDALKTYIEETGHANPPLRYKNTADYRLGQWVSNQRAAKKKNILSAERTKLLESFNGWTWDAKI